MPAAARTRCAMHAASLHGARAAFASARALLDSTQPSLCSPLAAAQASAASALGCVAALVRAAALSLAAGSPCRRRVALAARCTQRRPWRPRCVRQCSCSPRPDPRSARRCPRLKPAPPRRSAASLRSPARRRSRSPPARHAGGGSHSLRDARSVAHGARAAFVGARALLDPTLALLAADRGSSQRRLGARLRRCARPRGGALARRRLAMPAAARARCAMHAASLMAPVLRSSVLALFSTRPDPRYARR